MSKVYKNKGAPRPTTQTRFFNKEFKTKEERIKNLFITDDTYLYLNKDLSEEYFWTSNIVANLLRVQIID